MKLVLTVAAAALFAASSPAVAAGGAVHNYYCNGLWMGPCAVSESETNGKVLAWCRNIPLGNGTFLERCMNLRVIRNKTCYPDPSACGQ